VGNYFKSGPNSPTDGNFWKQVKLSPARVYIDDNGYEDHTGEKRIDVTEDLGRLGESMSSLWDMPAVTTHSHTQAYNLVLEKAGALPHDPMNIRTINDVKNRTGVYGKTDDAKIETGPAPPVDTDLDGMPDEWERNMGFNPNDYSDHNGDHDNDGYTNIEEYINDLALVMLGEPSHNSTIEMTDKGPCFSSAPLTLHPCPYLGFGRIHMVLHRYIPDNAKGIVQIVDARGRIVQSLKPASSIAWNGRDVSGKPLSAGIYLVRWIQENKQVATRRMVVIR
jgi:hypothetical protein